FFFFFQAEDGIRDRNVTGVQTCALPIYSGYRGRYRRNRGARATVARPEDRRVARTRAHPPRSECSRPAAETESRRGVRSRSRFRSEERRVGKECRSWWAAGE